MDTQNKKYIEKFLDEFMLIEYRGRDHIVARAHYKNVFTQILPKYIHAEDEAMNDSLKVHEKNKIKNVKD